MPRGVYVRTEEYRRRMSKAMTGIKHSEESKRKMSEAMKGRPSHRKGKHLTEEHKRNLSKAMKGKGVGRKLSLETRRKMSEAGKGRKVSAETRMKISESKMGHEVSPEQRRKQSEALKGKYLGSNNPNWRGGLDPHHKRKARQEELLAIFRVRNPDGMICCHFCGVEITRFGGLAGDALVIHSLDENHENWEPSNKVPAHCSCHTSFHRRT